MAKETKNESSVEDNVRSNQPCSSLAFERNKDDHDDESKKSMREGREVYGRETRARVRKS